MHEPRSLTAKYLRGELAIPVPTTRRRGTGQKIRLLGATEHNLKDVDVTIPLNTLTCVTGVSGSGKSTLVHDVLYAAIKRAKGGWDKRVGAFETLEGTEFITDVVLVDQTPIGRTPRSNPVTYLKAFDPIRELFAATKDARARGLTASHFSFNVPGRPLRSVPGRRRSARRDAVPRRRLRAVRPVRRQALQAAGARGAATAAATIHQVLDLTVREALTFFSSSPKVLRRLQVLDEIGLGYLRLGQPATTLSGGEAQRIKIAAHLSSHGGERLLYILDEPTTGLHFDDIAKLLAAFRKLLEAGHTLLVIEHNLDVIKTADYIIDLGPEGGEAGGRWWRRARRSRSRRSTASYTGRYLAAGACRRPLARLLAAGRWRRDLMPRWRAAALIVLACAGLAMPVRAQSTVTFEQMVADLVRPNPDTRLRAVLALKQATYPESAVPLAGAIADSEDAIQLEAIAAELNVFLAEKIVPRKRVGLIVEVRNQISAIAVFNQGPAALNPRPVPAEVLTALRTATHDDNPRVSVEALYAFGALVDNVYGQREQMLLAESAWN